MLTPEIHDELKSRDAAGLREFAKDAGIQLSGPPNMKAETILKQIEAAIAALPPVPTTEEVTAAAAAAGIDIPENHTDPLADLQPPASDAPTDSSDDAQTEAPEEEAKASDGSPQEPPPPYSQELIDALPEELRPVPITPATVEPYDMTPVPTGPTISTDAAEFSTTGMPTVGGISDPDVEAEADALIAELGAGLCRMSHPDNGSSDAYEKDEAGDLLVPIVDVATMRSHGFEVVEAGA